MNGVPDRPPYFSWKDTIAWNIGQPPVNLQKAMEFLFPLDMLYFHGGFSIRLLEGSTWPIVLSQVYTLDALDPLNSRAKSDPRNAHRTFTSNVVLGTKKNIQNLSLELRQFNTAVNCIAHLLRWFAWPKKNGDFYISHRHVTANQYRVHLLNIPMASLWSKHIPTSLISTSLARPAGCSNRKQIQRASLPWTTGPPTAGVHPHPGAPFVRSLTLAATNINVRCRMMSLL